MNIGELIGQLMASPSGMALQGVVALALVELATGIAKAFAAGQFQLNLVDTWVRSQVAGRVIPIALLLVVGAAVPDLTGLGLQTDVLTVAGLAAAGVYAAAALKSIFDNVNPSAKDTPPPAE